MVLGSTEHREYLLERALAHIYSDVKFEFGSECKVKGKEGPGIIINYCTKLDECEWEGLKIKNIELYFHHDNSFGLYHPSDIKAI